jgi:hypothetical protein
MPHPGNPPSALGQVVCESEVPWGHQGCAVRCLGCGLGGLAWTCSCSSISSAGDAPSTLRVVGGTAPGRCTNMQLTCSPQHQQWQQLRMCGGGSCSIAACTCGRSVCRIGTALPHSGALPHSTSFVTGMSLAGDVLHAQATLRLPALLVACTFAAVRVKRACPPWAGWLRAGCAPAVRLLRGPGTTRGFAHCDSSRMPVHGCPTHITSARCATLS